MGIIICTADCSVKRGVGINFETYQQRRKFFSLPTYQSSAESGVEYSRMDTVGTSYLAGYFNLVVCWWFGLLDPDYPFRDVDYGMGCRV